MLKLLFKLSKICIPVLAQYMHEEGNGTFILTGWSLGACNVYVEFISLDTEVTFVDVDIFANETGIPTLYFQVFDSDRSAVPIRVPYSETADYYWDFLRYSASRPSPKPGCEFFLANSAQAQIFSFSLSSVAKFAKIEEFVGVSLLVHVNHHSLAKSAS